MPTETNKKSFMQRLFQRKKRPPKKTALDQNHTNEQQEQQLLSQSCTGDEHQRQQQDWEFMTSSSTSDIERVRSLYDHDDQQQNHLSFMFGAQEQQQQPPPPPPPPIMMATATRIPPSPDQQQEQQQSQSQLAQAFQEEQIGNSSTNNNNMGGDIPTTITTTTTTTETVLELPPSPPKKKSSSLLSLRSLTKSRRNSKLKAKTTEDELQHLMNIAQLYKQQQQQVSLHYPGGLKQSLKQIRSTSSSSLSYSTATPTLITTVSSSSLSSTNINDTAGTASNDFVVVVTTSPATTTTTTTLPLQHPQPHSRKLGSWADGQQQQQLFEQDEHVMTAPCIWSPPVNHNMKTTHQNQTWNELENTKQTISSKLWINTTNNNNTMGQQQEDVCIIQSHGPPNADTNNTSRNHPPSGLVGTGGENDRRPHRSSSLRQVNDPGRPSCSRTTRSLSPKILELKEKKRQFEQGFLELAQKTSSRQLQQQEEASQQKRALEEEEAVKRAKKNITFTTIHIREYERVIGDNPSVSNGVPLSLGWAYYPTIITNLHDYEQSRQGERCTCNEELILPSIYREVLLRDEWNFDMKDIRQATKVATAARATQINNNAKYLQKMAKHQMKEEKKNKNKKEKKEVVAV